MKLIIYQMYQTTVVDGVELPKSEEYMASVTIPYSEENEKRAKTEAYNGEYTIEDDGQPETETEATTDEVLNALLGVM